MSAEGNKIGAVASNCAGFRFFVRPHESEKMNQIMLAALEPFKTICAPRQIASFSLDAAEDLEWLRLQNREELYALVSYHYDQEAWQKLTALKSIPILEQLAILDTVLTDKVLLQKIVEISIKEDPLQTLGIITFFADRYPHRLTQDDFDPNSEFNQHLVLPSKNLSHDAMSVELPKTISTILLTKSGEINFGIIPLLKKRLIQDDLSFHKTLKRRLDTLLDNHSLRNIFPQIKAPTDYQSRGAELLQILHGLPPNTPVTDTQAREAALAAYLSHLRQIPPNGCFAMVVCQAELESNPRHCLEDFKSLILRGCLRRKTNNDSQDYPFLFSVQHTHLDEPDHDPNIHAIYQTMGVPKLSPRKKCATPLELIAALANGNPELFQRGKLAYEFQTRNGLLAMWHNAVAGMSEGKMSSMIKSEILRSVLHAIDAEYEGLTEKYHYLKKKLENEIVAKILQKMILFYDPELKHASAGNGGFVLYDHKWMRIDSLERFRSWLLLILTEAVQAINPADAEGSIILQKMAAGLRECIASPKFVDRLLSSYMDQAIKEPNKNIEVFRHTPWITRTGNSTEATLQVYRSRSENLKSKSIVAEDAEDLLNQLNEFYELHRHNPPYIPCRIEDLHAFNLLPFSEKPALKLQKKRYRISIHYQQKVIGLFKSRANLPEFHLEPAEGISLDQLRNRMLEEWNSVQPCNELELPNRERILDTLLISRMTRRARNKILSNSIAIADSNWASDSQDIYFYCFLNPFTKKIELWKMGHDFSNPSALNPDIWIQKQPWEIFYV